jgi:hypothetical protein
VGRSLLDALELPAAVLLSRRLPVAALGMKADAPAPAEHPVVVLDERRKRVPGRLVERLDRVHRRHSLIPRMNNPFSWNVRQW